MLHITRVIIVEGKYDKIKLQSVTDAQVITLDGFSVFSQREKLAAFRAIALNRGIIILTDSDSAGFKLRSFIGGALPKDCVKHAYIPDVCGKEKRKTAPSKEGKLGVEGISRETLEEILAPFADGEESNQRQALTKADFYADGLAGTPMSSSRRRAFAARAGLPSGIGANALLVYVNYAMTNDEYHRIIAEISAQTDN